MGHTHSVDSHVAKKNGGSNMAHLAVYQYCSEDYDETQQQQKLF